MAVLDEARLRAILREELDDAHERHLLFLGALGLDVDTPALQRADMIHLRRWRMIVDSSTTRAIAAVITAAVTTLMGFGVAALAGRFGAHPFN